MFHKMMFSQDSNFHGMMSCEASLYLKGCHTEEDQDLFLIIPDYRIHNNGLKLQEVRFQLNIKKNVLTVKAVR